MKASPGWRLRRSLVLLPAVAALALSSCSSVNTSSGASGNTSSASASSGGQGGQASTDAQGQSLITEATSESPTEFQGPAKPVAAPKNVKVAVITCLSILSGCVSPAKGAEQAAKTLGWQVRTFDGGGTPDKQNAQMLNAISWGANIILNIAIDPNAVQGGLRAAKQAGIPVGAGSNGLASPNPPVTPAPGKLGYAFDVAPDYAALGKKMAQWIAGDSGGKANVLVYSDKTFPSVLALQKGLLDGLKECSGCKVQPLQYFTGDQVAQVLPQSVVSQLRSNQDVNYVFLPYDPAAAAVVPAIAQAGLGQRVKLASVLGSQENVNYVRQGRVQAADAAYDNLYMGFALLDQAARLLTKQPLAEPQGENLPYVVLDKSNAPDSGSDWHAGFDYQGKFASLWKG